MSDQGEAQKRRRPMDHEQQPKDGLSRMGHIIVVISTEEAVSQGGWFDQWYDRRPEDEQLHMDDTCMYISEYAVITPEQMALLERAYGDPIPLWVKQMRAEDDNPSVVDGDDADV